MTSSEESANFVDVRSEKWTQLPKKSCSKYQCLHCLEHETVGGILFISTQFVVPILNVGQQKWQKQKKGMIERLNAV